METLDEQTLKILDDTFYGSIDDLAARISSNFRFAHYTSADTALRIIRGDGSDRSLWLRNATEMNDFSEIEYGQSCLELALGVEGVDDRFKRISDTLGIDFSTAVFGAMGAERARIKANTFLLSLSEHDAADVVGRLSMWRAYGGTSNVCLLLRTEAFMTHQTAYDAGITAVHYGGPDGFIQRFTRIVESVESNLDELAKLDLGLVAFNWKAVLDDLVLSTKHPSFEEEREWRVIYQRKEHPTRPAPPSKVVSIYGIVRVVHYLPMQNVPEAGVNNATLDEILERVIIGPTPNPGLVLEAFVNQLGEAGVTNPEQRVVASHIPLRR